jgi:epoxyqueuosine reductase
MTSLELIEKVQRMGADVCGIAGVGRFSSAPKGFHPSDILPEAVSVIVFAKQFPKGVFHAKTNAPYTLIRESLMHTIDAISIQLVMDIEQAGFLAVPIPSAEPYTYWDKDNREGRGLLSLRHAAALSGLGWIGRNTLLVNSTFGNRLWLSAVLTDIALDEDPLAENLCPDNCRICLDACPQQALDGTTIVQRKCREICFSSTEGGGYLYACNLCRKECPYSRI